MEGWIKLHRHLMEKAIWKSSTAQQKVILITLLLMADHKGNEWEWKGNKFKTKPGQMVTSVNSIIKEAGEDITRQNVRTALAKFEKYEFLTYESTKRGMLVTIVNWGTYQSFLDEGNQEGNQEVTINQPSANHQLTTNKNVRMKECKNNIFKPPSLEEVEEYCRARKNGINARSFIDFYSSKGWMVGKNKMKDWKACVRTWEARNPVPKHPASNGFERIGGT